MVKAAAAQGRVCRRRTEPDYASATWTTASAKARGILRQVVPNAPLISVCSYLPEKSWHRLKAPGVARHCVALERMGTPMIGASASRF
jgi:hypothetical protein